VPGASLLFSGGCKSQAEAGKTQIEMEKPEEFAVDEWRRSFCIIL